MGRRSRQREAASRPAATKAKAKAGPTAAPGARPRSAAGRPSRERALDRLSPARRVLAIYVGCAMVLAFVVVVGIAVLGGSYGPFVTLAVAILGSGLAHTWASPKLRELQLTDEDRMMQTLAGGLLVITLLLAVAGAIVS